MLIQNTQSIKQNKQFKFLLLYNFSVLLFDTLCFNWCLCVIEFIPLSDELSYCLESPKKKQVK